MTFTDDEPVFLCSPDRQSCPKNGCGATAEPAALHLQAECRRYRGGTP